MKGTMARILVMALPAMFALSMGCDNGDKEEEDATSDADAADQTVDQSDPESDLEPDPEPDPSPDPENDLTEDQVEDTMEDTITDTVGDTADSASICDENQGSGTITFAGDHTAGPFQHAVFFEDPEYGYHSAFVSSADGCCALYEMWREINRGAHEVLNPALGTAESEEDGGAACNAYLDFVDTIQWIDDLVWPAGSSAPEIMIDGLDSGTYNASGTADGYIDILIIWVNASYYGTFGGVLGDCSGVTTWDDWLALETSAREAANATMPMAYNVEGDVIVTVDSGTRTFSGTDNVFRFDDDSTDTASFELNVVDCPID